MTDTNYDVIIVGGRPAGATLAARLGRQGLRVLLLERATFPSAPAASCPVIYPATMRLLDEIGADEREYARGRRASCRKPSAETAPRDPGVNRSTSAAASGTARSERSAPASRSTAGAATRNGSMPRLPWCETSVPWYRRSCQ